MEMPATRDDHISDATRLRQRGLRVTGPRLAILSTLEEVGGHRAVDELVLALRQAGYHHARTTVYNALDDLARAGLVRAAPVDAGALRYESAGPVHHHFVCRRCGLIRNVPVAPDLAARSLPEVSGGSIDELDVVYRGLCSACLELARSNGGERAPGEPSRVETADDLAERAERAERADQAAAARGEGGSTGHGSSGHGSNGHGSNGHGAERHGEHEDREDRPPWAVGQS